VTGDLALTIGRQEADNIEFKSAVVDRDKICKAICALANDLPGRGEGYLVTVPAAISPPVSFDGRVFVRVGPSTQVATPDEERVLRERRQAADLPFDQQPVPGSTDVMTSQCSNQDQLVRRSCGDHQSRRPVRIGHSTKFRSPQ